MHIPIGFVNVSFKCLRNSKIDFKPYVLLECVLKDVIKYFIGGRDLKGTY